MNLKEYKQAIANTPVMYPVFKITKVPDWAQDYVKKGDEVVRDVNAYYPAYEEVPTVIILKSKQQVGMGVSCMKFVEYRKFEGVL